MSHTTGRWVLESSLRHSCRPELKRKEERPAPVTGFFQEPHLEVNQALHSWDMGGWMVVLLSHPQATHVSPFPCLDCNLGHMLIHWIHAGMTIKFLCKERRNKTRNHNTSKHCCYFWLLARTKLPVDRRTFSASDPERTGYSRYSSNFGSPYLG